VLLAIANRRACLLANHGMLVLRRRSAQALDLASNSRRSANSTGAPASSVQPVLLDAAEMATVLEKFAGYGQQA
jgi:L-fuculose-phosphate aldolase